MTVIIKLSHADILAAIEEWLYQTHDVDVSPDKIQLLVTRSETAPDVVVAEVAGGSGSALHGPVPVMLDAPKTIRKVFKRMETDAEFLERLAAQGPWVKPYAKDLTGDTLDYFADHNFKIQRRIVEATA